MADCYSLGIDISSKEHTLEETKGFYRALKKTYYASYIRSFKYSEPRYDKYVEGIEFNIQTSAFSKSNILNTERTCAIFAKDEIPMVFALRKDFPREVLHVHLRPKDLPVSPCLYEEPYSEIRIRLTWEMFIEDIHQWYKRASDGTAHLPGQALEPLILDGLSLLVSNKFFDTEKIHIASKHYGFMLCHLIDWTKDLPQDATVLIPINTKSMVSRCIHYTPQTFSELLEITKEFGVDLRLELSEFTYKIEELLDANTKAGPASNGIRKNIVVGKFQDFSKSLRFLENLPQKAETKLQEVFKHITNSAATNKKETRQKMLSWMPMIWLRLPKKKSEEGQEEWIEDIAFLLSKSLGEVCEKIGIYTKQNGYMIHEKRLPDVMANELKVPDGIAYVAVVKPIPSLDIKMAQKLSDVKKDAKKYFAVGAGALGSQVITNLTRLGIGNWDVLDDDILLPHNLGRHALFAEDAPLRKAAILSNKLNSLMDDADFSKPILRNFLEYKDGLADYDLIFDFSASTAAVRHMAIYSERPAIVSAFMTKNGKYLIYLYEGDDKSVRVDDIEYQLACECVINQELNSVLEVHDEQEIRYSGACGDITTILPQDRVAVHAGIVSSYIKQNIDNSRTIISIWELTDDCLVKRHNISPSRVQVHQVKDWEMRLSEKVIKKMMDHRSIKLPLETGGVLIGGFDLYNKIVYIVDIIPSPKDSTEEPYSYIRGFEGLLEKIEKIKNISGRRLDYVGEWHAHPRGVTPGHLDKKALKEQTEEMSLAGLPAIMIIIGDKGKYKILLKQD